MLKTGIEYYLKNLDCHNKHSRNLFTRKINHHIEKMLVLS